MRYAPLSLLILLPAALAACGVRLTGSWIVALPLAPRAVVHWMRA